MRIGKLDLNQLNSELERIDTLHNRLSEVEKSLKQVQFQSAQADFVHARPTFNNIAFTWTGGSTALSWTAGWLKDKNAITTGTAYSNAPSYAVGEGHATIPVAHNIAVPAGSLTLTASTYYWLGWDATNSKMYAVTDITKLYTKPSIQIICQLFTGTAGQTGVVGGGGSQGGADLSGARYKLF